MSCIFCSNPTERLPIEHIIPESLGNIRYVLNPTSICSGCNNRFSKFEEKALLNSILGFERTRLGITTKKGKASIGKVGPITFTANLDHGKNYIFAKGITSNEILSINNEDKTFQIKVPSFHKSEMSVSKLLLKVALESLYQSKKKDLYQKYNFDELREHLTFKNNDDWPFIATKIELQKFNSVPGFYDKYYLKRELQCELLYTELSEQTLLFKFKYGSARFITNLINRNYNWAGPYLHADENARIYPAHLNKHLSASTKLKL